MTVVFGKGEYTQKQGRALTGRGRRLCLVNAVGRTDGFYDTQLSTVSALEPRMGRWALEAEIARYHHSTILYI